MDTTGDMPLQTSSVFAKCVVRDGVLLAKLHGPSVGQREAPIITQIIAAEMEASPDLHALVLDFSKVNFLNSMGLGMCIDLRNRMAASRGRVVLFGVCAQLLETLKLTKMDRLFTIENDLKKLQAAVAK